MNKTEIPFASPGFEHIELSIQRRAELLEKTQIGRGLEWSELQRLSGFLDCYKGETGSIVCHQGDVSSFLCIICRGRVDIIRKDVGQHDKIIASLGPTNALGEMSLIDGEPRSATVVVHTPVEMLVLTRESYECMAEEYPRMWGKMVVKIGRVLSRRLRQTSGILAEYLES